MKSKSNNLHLHLNLSPPLLTSPSSSFNSWNAPLLLSFVFLISTLRFVIGLFPSYLHPDEFFQNPEPAAAWILNNGAELPWEFNPDYPLRSILPIYLTTGWLFSLAKFFGYTQPMVLYTLTRGVFIVLSLWTDYLIYHLSNGHPVLLPWMAFSHVQMYLTHSFANSFITFLFTVCLYCLFTKRTSSSSSSSSSSSTLVKNDSVSENEKNADCTTHGCWNMFVVGVVGTLALFAHPTFVCFFAPFSVGVFLVKKMTRRAFIAGMLGACLSFSACVVADSLMYKGRWNAMVITVLNFVEYNRNPLNTQSHGHHPYYTHALVNLPFLFGPIFMTSPCFLSLCQSPMKTKKTMKRLWSFTFSTSRSFWLMLSFLSGLLSLSFISHQEPRFLLPLYPLVLLLFSSSPSPSPSPSRRSSLFFVFISFLFLFVLRFHQSGVLECGLHLSASLSPASLSLTFNASSGPFPPLPIITWQTYPLPKFLLPSTFTSYPIHQLGTPPLITSFDVSNGSTIQHHGIINNNNNNNNNNSNNNNTKNDDGNDSFISLFLSSNSHLVSSLSSSITTTTTRAFYLITPHPISIPKASPSTSSSIENNDEDDTIVDVLFTTYSLTFDDWDVVMRGNAQTSLTNVTK